MELGYVTAAQGRIYIDGILIDECYDIRYSYQESKEPIYGYNSKHFDTVLSGQAIIQGSFTINYVHDSYLRAILDRIEKEKGKSSIEQKKKTTKLDNSYKTKMTEYKNIQGEVKEKKQEKKVIEGKNIELKAQRTIEENRILLERQDLQVKYDDAKEAEDSFMDGLSENELIQYYSDQQQVGQLSSEVQELQDSLVYNANKINSKIDYFMSDDTPGIDTTELEQQRDDITNKYAAEILQKKNELEDLLNNNNTLKNGLTLEYTTQNAKTNLDNFNSSNNIQSINDQIIKNQSNIDRLQKEIGELIGKAEGIKEDIRKAKNENITKGNDIIGYLESLKEADKPKNRAEDQKIGFNIMIDFNGGTHAILKECHLIGHSFSIEQSGEPVREQYAFLARDIETFLGA